MLQVRIIKWNDHSSFEKKSNQTKKKKEKQQQNTTDSRWIWTIFICLIFPTLLTRSTLLAFLGATTTTIILMAHHYNNGAFKNSSSFSYCSLLASTNIHKYTVFAEMNKNCKQNLFVVDQPLLAASPRSLYVCCCMATSDGGSSINRHGVVSYTHEFTHHLLISIESGPIRNSAR